MHQREAAAMRLAENGLGQFRIVIGHVGQDLRQRNIADDALGRQKRIAAAAGEIGVDG
ncbi:hypothetical protein D3C87_1999630 [compost metagenome]